ncbi:NAD-P-binding protein [Mycena sanguinolenta]|nr:NAD-P-binding protein [Mycena sanguinolenta]
MGITWDLITSLISESFPPKPTFTLKDVPDLSGQVFIVTGGNSGLGFETTKVLVTHGAKVYIATRNRSKAEDAIQSIFKGTGKSPIFLELDLADLDSVANAARTFSKEESRLDVLYNSAGVMIPPVSEITRQGYDLQFGLVLGHFYFTKLLLPLLVSTAACTPGGKTRIINVSSGAHHFSGMNFATFKDGPERQKYSTHRLYAQSKFAVVVFATELARRYGSQGIVSTSMNPGNVATNLQKEIRGFQASVAGLMLHPARPHGIITHVWAGTAKETADYNGNYLRPWARLGKARRDTQDPVIGAKLWAWLDEQVEIWSNH